MHNCIGWFYNICYRISVKESENLEQCLYARHEKPVSNIEDVQILRQALKTDTILLWRTRHHTTKTKGITLLSVSCRLCHTCKGPTEWYICIYVWVMFDFIQMFCLFQQDSSRPHSDLCGSIVALCRVLRWCAYIETFWPLWKALSCWAGKI